MVKELKQMVNAISEQSEQSKTKALFLSPVLVTIMIAIKTEEIITDTRRIQKGKIYKQVRSRYTEDSKR